MKEKQFICEETGDCGEKGVEETQPLKATEVGGQVLILSGCNDFFY